MPNMAWLWLAAIVLFAAVEACTVTMVSLWFVGGALAAMIAALCGGELWLQFVLFFAVSIALFVCFRPLVKKYLRPKIVQTNAPGNIGKTAVVTEDIDNLRGEGAVKLAGVLWSAYSADGRPIKAGSVVKITDIRGVKLCVEPVPAAVEN